jgi:hypothetical protein
MAAIWRKFRAVTQAGRFRWLEIVSAAFISGPTNQLNHRSGAGRLLHIRVAPLLWACALCFIASEALLSFGAIAQTAAVAMDGGSPSNGARPAKSAPALLPSSEQDPAVRSAKSIECAQKADARGLIGKQRKRFLHECRRGA